MKKTFLLLATVFICAMGCDNEPLEGEFVVDDGVEVTDDTTGDGTDDGTDDPPVDSREFMAATLGTTSYTNLRPFSYSLPGDPSAVSVPSYSGSLYLRIQGGNYILGPDFPAEPGSFEINLFIGLEGENFVTGLQTLQDDEDWSQEESGYNMIYWDDTDNTTQELGGTLTIDVIDLEARFIQGSFQFSFNRLNELLEVVETIEVTGTFDYDLDDEYFD